MAIQDASVGLRAASMDIAAWLRANGRSKRPWLLVGPGANKATSQRAAGEGFAVLATGGAAERLNSDLALVVDVEQLAKRGEQIGKFAAFVAVPNEPHQRGWATGRSLTSFAREIPALQALADEGRLLSFDLWTAKSSPSGGVLGDFHTDEVALRVLVEGGVRIARHTGFLPRSDPSPGFEATRSTLSRATGGVARLRRDSRISYGPYGYPTPARIFVGTDDEQTIGLRILQYSIEKHSTMDVSVEALDWRSMPVPRDPRNRSKTGFSFCRFDIPRLCGYTGRGVYVDADMQVFSDITELWTMSLEQADLLYSLGPPAQGRTPQTSVMLINCDSLRWDVKKIIDGLDRGAYSYKELMSDLCVVPKGRAKPLLPYWWNSLELYEPGRTALLHYTDMHRQPWVSSVNPNAGIWYDCCAEAIAHGFIDLGEIAAAVEMGHVSPEMFDWIGQQPPQDYTEHAACWVPPYNRFVVPSAPEGAVTLIADRRLLGWAWDPALPDDPIEVGVFDGETLLFAFPCEEPGEFLERYGKGNGRHAFNVSVPKEVLVSNTPSLSVRTLGHGVELKGSPLELMR